MKFRYIIAAASIALASNAVAQNTEAAYFLEDYTYRYQMNPAFANGRNYVALPGLGNLNIGVNGTLGVQDVLYNVNGKTTTFLNPSLSAAEVLKNIGDNNKFNIDTKVQVLSFGFKAFGGYNTFAINARVGAGVKLPGSVFSLLKEGVQNKTYEIANIKGYGTAFAEVMLGHSHQITPEIRVGANLKVLVGAGNVNIDFKRADLELGTDSWNIVTEAKVNANVKGLTYKTEVNDYGRTYVNGVDVDSPGPNGFGVAFDLGAVYSPAFLPDFQFSASVLDLGFISWKNNMEASTKGVKKFATDKYTFNVDDDASNSFDNEWDKIKDDISALYELENLGDQGSQAKMLGATFNIGGLYTLPYYRNLKFGLLNTTHIQGPFTWTDFRLSANVMPCKVFDASVSASMGTFGFGLGWMINLHAPGFNLFLGMDKTPTKLAKQGVPLNSNADFNMGINFLF